LSPDVYKRDLYSSIIKGNRKVGIPEELRQEELEHSSFFGRVTSENFV